MDGVQDLLGLGVRFIQIVFVFIFAMTFLLSLFYLLFASKNPFRRRKAYLFSIGGSIGMLLSLYLPLIITYIKSGTQQKINTTENLYSVLDWTQPWGTITFHLMRIFFEPMIFFGFVFGYLTWLTASKGPPRKRIGMGMVIGAPIFWFILKFSPDIYHFFVPQP
ncbi:hypothetical protein [Bacillus infantis]|uniref:hypothetical protein n=1 Tax=Bacillus infantis TaxID=324767 RepID=UPI0020A0B9B7|nr:hypothetical protein [Bacillus infantis]MCP1161363.1 hypothetical protein [Bacillus infantis]